MLQLKRSDLEVIASNTEHCMFIGYLEHLCQGANGYSEVLDRYYPNMCFFDQHRFACGDWKWGHFRQHCNREYRTGETCGMKLIMQTVPVGQKCKLCEKIDTKQRRRAAEVERINRWQREGGKFSASIERSYDMIKTLDREIYDLNCERQRRLQAI